VININRLEFLILRRLMFEITIMGFVDFKSDQARSVKCILFLGRRAADPLVANSIINK